MMKKRVILTNLCLCVLLVATLYFALTHGASNLNLGHLSNTDLNVLFNIRLPRIVSALIAGAALSVSGAFFQGALHNPIADPGIMGINAAAYLCQVLWIVILPGAFFGKYIAAIIGGLIAFAILLLFQKQMDPYRLLIVGVALNAVFTGVIEIVAPSKSGVSLATSTWSSTFVLAIIGIIGLICSLIFAEWGNYLKVNDAHLTALGVSPKLLRLVLLLIAVVLASVTTASIGMIAFIGIIVPQIGRQIIGHDYQQIIPFSILAGSWLMLFVDTIGRTINPPNEIAASSLLAIIGGPFMIFILWKTARGHKNV